MKGHSCSATSVRSRLSLLFLVLGISFLFSTTALAFTASLNVQGMPKKLPDGSQPANVPIANFRWLIEEDTTHAVTPGVSDPNSLAFSLHKAHAPVVASGDQANAAPLETSIAGSSPWKDGHTEFPHSKYTIDRL